MTHEEMRDWHRRMGFPSLREAAEAMRLPPKTYHNYYYGRWDGSASVIPPNIALLTELLEKQKKV